MMENQVIYRRIRGRIVPIKLDRKKQIASGVGYVAGGVALSGASAGTAAYMLGKSASKGVKSKSFATTASWLYEARKHHRATKLEKLFTPRFTANAFKLGKSSLKLAKMSKYLYTGGLLAGTILAGTGIQKIMGQKGSEPTVKSNLAYDVGGMAVIGTSNYGFVKMFQKMKGFKNIRRLLILK